MTEKQMSVSETEKQTSVSDMFCTKIFRALFYLIPQAVLISLNIQNESLRDALRLWGLKRHAWVIYL